MALQPLINIPRLMIRRGQARKAHDTLQRLYRAALDRATTEVGASAVDLGAVIHGDQQHHDVSQHLWATLLEDGLRALAAAGQWQQAADTATAHRGVGPHLWSGRQAVILARLQTGNAAQAAALVEASATNSPAEQAVQALLHTFCALDGHLRPHRLAAARAQAHRLIALDDPTTIHFRTQAALTAIALADLAGTPDPRLHEATIAAAAADAYAARAVLASLGEQAQPLRAVVVAGGLDPSAARYPDLTEKLTIHTERALERVRKLLTAKTPA
jgi:hypothetical protein